MSNGLGKFYGIGVGPGDPGLLTLKAVSALKEADVIFDVIGPNSKKSVSGGILDTIGLKSERCPLTFSMSIDYDTRHNAIVANAEIVAEKLKSGKTCAFATIGDPMVYSTYIYLRDELLKLIPDLNIETIPGITSFQAVAAKSELPLVEDCETLCVIPAFSEENIDDFPIASADTIVFLKTYHTRNCILELLETRNIKFDAVYAARIGLEGEIICKNIDKIKDLPEEYLSMLIVKTKK
jgi:precorrin-2/cobalt-factor-2 C20-methyltransferase